MDAQGQFTTHHLITVEAGMGTPEIVAAILTVARMIREKETMTASQVFQEYGTFLRKLQEPRAAES